MAIELDFTGYEETEESEELKAYKALVKEVAGKYTRAHGFCNEVNNALREIGIPNEPRKAPIKITTSIGFEFKVEALPSEFKDLDEDQIKELLCEKVGRLRVSNGSGSFSLRPNVIETVEVIAPDDPATVGMDVEWRASSDGRVAHAILPDHLIDRAYYQVATACANHIGRNLLRSAETSAAYRHCHNCTRTLNTDSDRARRNMGMSRRDRYAVA